MLGYLAEGYADVRTKLSGQEDTTTVAAIKDEIRNKWKRDFKPKDETSNEFALSVDQKKKGKRKFKGKCCKCGKLGHKAADCKGDFKGVCFECEEDGHFAKDCPKKGDKEKMGMFVGITMTVTKTQKGRFQNACRRMDHGQDTLLNILSPVPWFQARWARA